LALDVPCLQADVDRHTAFRIFQYLRDGFFIDEYTKSVTLHMVLDNQAAASFVYWQLHLKQLPSGSFLGRAFFQTTPAALGVSTKAPLWSALLCTFAVLLACVHASAILFSGSGRLERDELPTCSPAWKGNPTQMMRQQSSTSSCSSLLEVRPDVASVAPHLEVHPCSQGTHIARHTIPVKQTQSMGATPSSERNGITLLPMRHRIFKNKISAHTVLPAGEKGEKLLANSRISPLEPVLSSQVLAAEGARDTRVEAGDNDIATTPRVKHSLEVQQGISSTSALASPRSDSSWTGKHAYHDLVATMLNPSRQRLPEQESSLRYSKPSVPNDTPSRPRPCRPETVAQPHLQRIHSRQDSPWSRCLRFATVVSALSSAAVLLSFHLMNRKAHLLVHTFELSPGGTASYASTSSIYHNLLASARMLLRARARSFSETEPSVSESSGRPCHLGDSQGAQAIAVSDTPPEDPVWVQPTDVSPLEAYISMMVRPSA
jgi:hypothetical protein